MVLWRGSGIGVGAAAVVILLAILMVYLAPDTQVSRVGSTWLRALCLPIIAGLLILVALLPFYVIFLTACRLCLVVESLVGLAYVPDGVFELPNWALYFPHIA